jgi:glycosyltransferase involved in cell wall biosynthesis
MHRTDSERLSNVSELLFQLASAPLANAELVARLNAVRELLDRPEEVSRPFLSVLLRTQGKRIEPLKDALLCLVGQTDQDFEVIVLAHNATPDAAASVREVVERQPQPFASRVSLIEVNEGTRAKPLNVGFEAASGKYLAVFDDDDLVFANWVEEFHRAADVADGRVLRALVANQTVTPETWPGGTSGFRTGSRPAVEFPVVFDQISHFLVNASPFMGWAFPRRLFTLYGFRFDEKLVVCEDWDIILRGTVLCGVQEIAELTSIYRRWQGGGDSSYTSHSTAAWTGSEQRVIDRNDSSVLLLPPGSIAELRRLALLDDAWKRYSFLFNGNQLRQPLDAMWVAAAPGVKLAVRGAKRIRRSLRR